MNTKHKIIENTLKYLQGKYGRSRILVKDYWEGDENAIGIIDKNEKMLAYFAYYESDSDKMFYLSLEELTPNEDFPYKSIGEFGNLTLAELENIIVKHLEL
jgi:hypothetical protein